MRNRLAAGALMVCLIIPVIAAAQQESGRELLDKARDSAGSTPKLRRVDTSEQTVVLIQGVKRVEQKAQKTVTTIEIDTSKALARQTSTIQGQSLILLRQGEKAAMKLGDGPWRAPSEPFIAAARDVGNLFVCEIETPEDKQNAPNWVVTGTEVVDGQDAYVVETEGNSCVALAQQRMTKGIAKNFPDPEQRPVVKVLEYSARHWISKANYWRLRAQQTSKVQISTKLPDGSQQLIEQLSESNSTYTYEHVNIEVPDDAKRALADVANRATTRGAGAEGGKAQ